MDGFDGTLRSSAIRVAYERPTSNGPYGTRTFCVQIRLRAEKWTSLQPTLSLAVVGRVQAVTGLPEILRVLDNLAIVEH